MWFSSMGEMRVVKILIKSNHSKEGRLGLFVEYWVSLIQSLFFFYLKILNFENQYKL